MSRAHNSRFVPIVSLIIVTRVDQLFHQCARHISVGIRGLLVPRSSPHPHALAHLQPHSFHTAFFALLTAKVLLLQRSSTRKQYIAFHTQNHKPAAGLQVQVRGYLRKNVLSLSTPSGLRRQCTSDHGSSGPLWSFNAQQQPVGGCRAGLIGQ